MAVLNVGVPIRSVLNACGGVGPANMEAAMPRILKVILVAVA